MSVLSIFIVALNSCAALYIQRHVYIISATLHYFPPVFKVCQYCTPSCAPRSHDKQRPLSSVQITLHISLHRECTTRRRPQFPLLLPIVPLPSIKKKRPASRPRNKNSVAQTHVIPLQSPQHDTCISHPIATSNATWI